MINNIKNKIKIILILGIVIIISRLISNSVFIAGTPRVNPNFISSLINLPKNIAMLPNKLYINLFRFNNSSTKPSIVNIPEKPSIANIPEVLFKPVTKGIKAYDDKATNTIYIKYDKNANFIKKIITAPDGRVFEIYVPEGIK